MKLHNRNAGERADLGGAMTDISFLLIVFFLVTAVFVTEDGLLSQLPELDSVPQYEEVTSVLQIEMIDDTRFIIDGIEFPNAAKVKTFVEEKTKISQTLFGLLYVKEGIQYGAVVEFISLLKQSGVSELTISSGNSTAEQSVAFPVAVPNIEGSTGAAGTSTN